jgi:hypothetical protein
MALTPQEQEELSRIHVLSQFGDLPETMQSRFRELRDRDEALEIPEPTLDVVWIPAQRNRETAADNAVEELAAEPRQPVAAPIPAAAPAPAVTPGKAVADLSAFETSFSAPDAYFASAPVGGFVPSQYFGSGRSA